MLDPDGTFELRNALRPIRPGRTHGMMIGFCPATAEKVSKFLTNQQSCVQWRIQGFSNGGTRFRLPIM